MPIFEFRCSECGHFFETIFMNSSHEAAMACPECRSNSLDRVMSKTSHVMKPGTGDQKTTLTTKSCASGNHCMTLDIPGPTR